VCEYLEALDSGNPVHPREARYLSPTDPAAAWNVKEGRGKFGYFNNYLIDTDHAVIVDVEATPARLSQEIIATKTMLERVEEAHHLRPERLAADKAYGTGPFLGWLPREAFTFDPEKNHYSCPQNKLLKHCTFRADSPIHIYRATPADCRPCPIRQQCTRGKQRSLSVPFDESTPWKSWLFRIRKSFNSRAVYGRR